MAHSVCDDDPRTIAQRRADALGALAAGADRLACACGSADCLVGAGADERATNVVLYLIGEAAAFDAQPDPHMSGERPPGRPITPGMTLEEMMTPTPSPTRPRRHHGRADHRWRRGVAGAGGRIGPRRRQIAPVSGGRRCTGPSPWSTRHRQRRVNAWLRSLRTSMHGREPTSREGYATTCLRTLQRSDEGLDVWTLHRLFSVVPFRLDTNVV
nr:DUF222 domain-containing protein [Mycobacterium alsense]